MLAKCKYSGSCIPKCSSLNCHQLALGKAISIYRMEAELKGCAFPIYFQYGMFGLCVHYVCIAFVYPVPYPSHHVRTQSSCSPIHCEASWCLQQGKLFACLLCGGQMQRHNYGHHQLYKVYRTSPVNHYTFGKALNIKH